MTKLQNHLMQLVKEIDSVCSEKEIPYSLYGRTAGCAVKDHQFVTKCHQFQIMMLAKDILTLKQALTEKNIPNRAFEDMSTNPNLAWNRVRYVDTGTTVIDRADPIAYEKMGVAVTIIPAYTDKLGKLNELLEIGAIYENGGAVHVEHKAGKRQKAAVLAYRCVSKTLGKKFAANMIYRSLEKDPGKKGKSVNVRETPNYKTRMNRSMITKTKRVAFEKQELPVPEADKTYFKTLYGEDWKEVYAEPLPSVNRVECICDDIDSYELYLELFREQGIDMYDLYRREREYENWMQNVFEVWKHKSLGTLQAGKMSVDRIAMHLHYDAARMQKLADAAGSKKFQSLMKPYIKRMEKYKKYGLGFFVNEELHHYAEQYYKKQEGNTQIPDEVYSMVPEAHKKRNLEEFLQKYEK